eukprot:TRINITY_DN1051_c0_g1_i2.p1 TRINITY_DN1051_c0_g1~~TRINITY_DN1051_c0_g1_i2.p1  ORF type:complete len:310 (-),score=37.75 TRINITY_DN1051_c0_g1_i2:86-1015(-)
MVMLILLILLILLMLLMVLTNNTKIVSKYSNITWLAYTNNRVSFYIGNSCDVEVEEMGVCKCRKRTDLYCFIHRKAVCESCITDGSHSTCYIATFLEWLKFGDRRVPPPICTLCDKTMNEDDELIRFSTLQNFHLKCIDEYGSNIPKNSPREAYTIPNNTTVMLPPMSKSVLAIDIRNRLRKFDWMDHLFDEDGTNEVIVDEIVKQSSLTDLRASTLSSRNVGNHAPEPSTDHQSIDIEDPEQKYGKNRNVGKHMITNFFSTFNEKGERTWNVTKMIIFAILAFIAFIILMVLLSINDNDLVIVQETKT